MKYIFTTDEVERLEKTVSASVKQYIEGVLAPGVIVLVKKYINEGEARVAGSLVGWMALKGKDALRAMPQYFLDNLSFSEPLAYTMADMIVEQCGDALQKAVPDFNVQAIRLPWKTKVDPAALTDANQQTSKSIPTPVTVAQEPEVVAHEQQGLRHQDAEERLAIRVRMVEQLAGIKFDNPNLAERFRHVIRPALKGVKDLADARRQLALTEDKGGVGMGHNQVEEVIGLIERLHAKDRELETRAVTAKPVAPASMLPMVEEHEELVPMVTGGIASAPAGPRNDAGQKLNQLIQQSAADQPMDLGRTMHDVVARPIAMGPIEELRTMDLTDFRRLAAKSGAAANKIRQRLAVLREDGIDRYAAGIKAWRESAVYGVYVRMIRQGLVEGRPIEDIAAADTSDPERFSGEELQAVIELNKSLRF